MIKLLATDLDGTLFYPKKRFTLIDKSNAKFLKDFAAAGGKVVLVTGRDRRISMKVKKKTGVDLAVLGCNGAFIYKDNKFVKSKPIPKDVLIDIYMNLKANYNCFAFFIFDEDDSIKISPMNANKITTYLAVLFNQFNFAYKEKYIISEEEAIKSMVNGRVFKFMPIFGITPSASKRAFEAGIALKEQYKNKLTITPASIAIEITNHDVNKANTLLEYIDTLGIKKEEVAVCGDSYNDLPMFQTFPNSFGMANGEKAVLESAKHIITKVSDVSKYVLDENGKLKE